METNDEVILDTDLETETTENEIEQEEDVEALKKKIDELTVQKDHWRKKAEKPETKPEVKAEIEQGGLSQKDVIYLAKADIHEEDIDEVVELAKLKKVSVAEAHKFMAPILKERQEERQTALATQSRGGNRGTSKETPEVLISKAIRGEEVDPEKLAAARMAQKLKQ